LMGSMHTNLEETHDWDRVAEFYAERARGGVSLMVTGGIAPNKEGGVFPNAAGLCSEEDIAHHKIVTQSMRQVEKSPCKFYMLDAMLIALIVWRLRR